jgi:serine/threonine protein kinase/Tfp pilus assembly protein PilF
MKCPKCHFKNPDDSKFCKECGTQIISSEEISPTKTLETPTDKLSSGITFAGRYEIIEELGKGGMGRVYRVKDEKLDEEMALKVLKPEIAADKGMIERFKNELKLARKIAHRNVCKMYDLNEEEETPYITMEYVKGEDLKSFIRKKKKLKEEEVIALAKQVCEGLAEAHELGVVHRDLKPQNIMIDEKSNAKVMDFGIARSVEAPGITHTGMMIGTPDYISPEQAEGEEADQRSDIYALGVILYEMVTGSVPFKGDTAFSVALKHKSKLPSDPKKLNPDVSENLSRLILICMEKDRQRRYQTAEGLLNDLRNIEDGLPLGTKIRPRRVTFVAALIRKKLFIPSVVVAIVIIAVIIWQLLPEAPSKTSIAVLPLEDISPKKDQEYYCNGLAEDLITRLNKIDALKVPGRTSSFSFKGRGSSLREIGEKLKVDNILEGSLRKVGNKLHVTVRLIKAADGYPIWSDEYQRDAKDIFDLKDEICLAIIDKLKLKLLRGEMEKLVKRHTENLEAYNLYLKGRYFWNKRHEGGLQKGLESFNQAIKKDSSYAPAHAGVADSLSMLGVYGLLPAKEVFPEAKAAALKAIEIDDMLAEAYSSLGWINMLYDWDWAAAEKALKRALEIDPNYAIGQMWYALHFSYLGRFEEARAAIMKALELEPLSLLLNAQFGLILYMGRQYDEAIEQCLKTLEMDPNYLLSHYILGLGYMGKGMWKEAISAYEKAVALSEGSPFFVGHLGYAYAMSGQKDKARGTLHQLNEISKKRYVSFYFKALIYLGLGEKDQFFKCLERAYEDREPLLSAGKSVPFLDNVRSDPKYKALLKKMNLE